jgi:hypothetical protein
MKFSQEKDKLIHVLAHFFKPIVQTSPSPTIDSLIIGFLMTKIRKIWENDDKENETVKRNILGFKIE